MKKLFLLSVLSFVMLLTSCSADEQTTNEQTTTTTYQAKVYYEGASCEVWLNQTKKQFSGSTLNMFVEKGDVITILTQGLQVDNTNNYNAPNINIPAKTTLNVNNVEVANGTNYLCYFVK
jgi:hypothetical protein